MTRAMPTPARAARPVAFLAAVLLAASVSADVVVPSDCMPPPDTYTGQIHARYAAGLVDLSNPEHMGFTHCDTLILPSPATNFETFGSTVKALISISGGPQQPMQAPANCTVRMDLTGQNGPTRSFDTEMLQLDISGGTLPASTVIRESPTRQSTGKTTITELPGGDFQISSFFDIFTELSLDGGQTWFPSEDQNGEPYAGRMTLGKAIVGTQQQSWGHVKSLYRNP